MSTSSHGDNAPSELAASLASAELVGATFGTVHVEGVLTEAPGAWLLRGRDQKGHRVLLQVAPLRAVKPEEQRARSELLKAMAQATDQLGQDLEVAVEQHGFAEGVGAGGALYWVLPWTGAAERFGQTRIDGHEGLLFAAVALLERLSARHARGRIDPLLHASLVVPRTGGADLLGAPIAVPVAWLAPQVEAPSWAPEERAVQEHRRSGDLWRLGEALRVLAEGIPAPRGFEVLLDRLIDPDPGRRLSSAEEAMIDLDGLQGTVQADRGALLEGVSRTGSLQAASETLLDHPTADVDVLEPGYADDRTLADDEDEDEDPEWDAPPIDSGVRARASDADEAPTMWMNRDEVSKVARAKASPSSEVHPKGPKGTVIGVRLPDENPMAYRDPEVGGVHFAPRRVAQAPTQVFEDRSRGGVRPKGHAPTSGRSPLQGPGGTVANEPVPYVPQVLSGPHGFGPGGTVAAEPSPLTGPPAGPLAGPPAGPLGGPLAGPPGAIGSGSGEPVESYRSSPEGRPAEPYHDSGDTPPSEPVAEARRGQPRRLALTLIALLLLAVAAGAVVQLLKPPPAEEIGRVPMGSTRLGPSTIGPLAVTPWNDVLLEAVPLSAIVVGERDGRILGAPPVRLLVPGEEPTAVLITAPGYEPVRLVLPTRGRVTVHLTSTGDVLDCPVEVSAPGSGPLEVVGLELKPDDKNRYAIPGAVVMRSSEGHGAWLVRCSTYGGQRRHRYVSRSLGKRSDILVEEPKAARVRINERPAGAAPASLTTPAGFVYVEAETAEGASVGRWIPAFRDVVVRLPRPATPPSSPSAERGSDKEADGPAEGRKRSQGARKN